MVHVPRRRADRAGDFEFAPLLQAGDLIVNGANSFYKDSIRYAERLREYGIHFADVGVSGGVWGLENGYGLMAGGDPEVIAPDQADSARPRPRARQRLGACRS